ncbi:MAG: O-antigen ligase family protein [Gemmatimonadetes bacterium]|nr:O-antigen ligase family protein [Gemmatimonadota bacterium]
MSETLASAGPRRPAGLWLGTGVALSTATQLRPGIPLGPGEILLAGWLGASFASMFWKNRLEYSTQARSFGLFWAASFLLMLAGLLAGIFMGLASSDPWHDLQAYCLVAALVMTALSKPGGVDEVRRAVPVAMVVSTIGPMAILLATFPGGTLGPLQAWIGPRFMGWSLNPNQVSLAMAPVPFLGVYGFLHAQRRAARAMYVLVVLLGTVLGLATLSDGLVVAWAGCVAVLVGWSWVRGLLRGRFPFARGAAIYVVAPAAVLGVMALTASAVFQRLTASAEVIYTTQGQGDLRLRLWSHGLQALAASPVVGLGPGGHSGYTSPFDNFEAHNTYIDWATASGVVGLLLLVALLVWAAGRTRGEPLLLATLLVLSMVSVFGHYLRHPTFWFYLAAITLARPAAPRGEGDGGGSQGAARAPAGAD